MPCSLLRRWAPHASDLAPTLFTPYPTTQELSATFASNSSSTSLLASHWSHLTHALSGLFCSSIHLLATPDVVTHHSPTQPSHHGLEFKCPAPLQNLNGNAFEEGVEEGQCREQHDSQGGGPAEGHSSNKGGNSGGGSSGASSSASSASSTSSGSCWRDIAPGAQPASAACGAKRRAGGGDVVLHSWLPRESVCGENLSPWLKLLPCRDQAGLAQLLSQRGNLYRTRE